MTIIDFWFYLNVCWRQNEDKTKSTWCPTEGQTDHGHMLQTGNRAELRAALCFYKHAIQTHTLWPQKTRRLQLRQEDSGWIWLVRLLTFSWGMTRTLSYDEIKLTSNCDTLKTDWIQELDCDRSSLKHEEAHVHHRSVENNPHETSVFPPAGLQCQRLPLRRWRPSLSVWNCQSTVSQISSKACSSAARSEVKLQHQFPKTCSMKKATTQHKHTASSQQEVFPGGQLKSDAPGSQSNSRLKSNFGGTSAHNPRWPPCVAVYRTLRLFLCRWMSLLVLTMLTMLTSLRLVTNVWWCEWSISCFFWGRKWLCMWAWP